MDLFRLFLEAWTDRMELFPGFLAIWLVKMGWSTKNSWRVLNHALTQTVFSSSQIAISNALSTSYFSIRVCTRWAQNLGWNNSTCSGEPPSYPFIFGHLQGPHKSIYNDRTGPPCMVVIELVETMRVAPNWLLSWRNFRCPQLAPFLAPTTFRTKS